MSTSHSALAQLKRDLAEQKRIEVCFEELKKPWHRPVRPLAFQLPWMLYFAFVLNHVGSGPFTPWLIAGAFLFMFCLFCGAADVVRQRDKMWRDIIRREAPVLHAKLQHKDPLEG
jgi:hypothetical protein